MKRLAFIVTALLVAAPAFAAGPADTDTFHDTAMSVYTWTTNSHATDAVDTAYVAVTDAMWSIAEVDTARKVWISLQHAAADTSGTVPYGESNAAAFGTADFQYEAQLLFMFEGSTGTGGSGTVDSCQVTVQYSNDNLNWVAGISEFQLTNSSPSTTKQLTLPAPFLRLFIDNGGAATGVGTLSMSYLRK